MAMSWEAAIEELPTKIRAELHAFEATTGPERASLLRKARYPAEKKIFNLLSTEKSIHLDERVEKAELNSSEALAAPCEMEMKGVVGRVPGEQLPKIRMQARRAGKPAPNIKSCGLSANLLNLQDNTQMRRNQ